jgi:circadian clock protein KaiB
MPRAGRSRANDEETSTVAPGIAPYLLRLYVAGSTPKSVQAIQIVKKLCASFPRGRFRYEVIDLYQAPGLARQDNIIAVPCLVKVHPGPRRAFIGITGNTNRMLLKLGLPMRDAEHGEAKGR